MDIKFAGIFEYSIWLKRLDLILLFRGSLPLHRLTTTEKDMLRCTPTHFVDDNPVSAKTALIALSFLRLTDLLFWSGLGFFSGDLLRYFFLWHLLPPNHKIESFLDYIYLSFKVFLVNLGGGTASCSLFQRSPEVRPGFLPRG